MSTDADGILDTSTLILLNELVDEVRSEIAEAAEYGVTAVPTFIINGQWSVPGAQDIEMFERIIERMLEKA